MLETHSKKLYLDYCHRIGIKPYDDILKIIDGKNNNLCIRKSDKGDNNPLQESDVFGFCLILTQNITNFIELEISNQPLNSNVLSALGSGLKANKTIQKLTLKNAFIDDNCLGAFIWVLNDNSSISELDLSQNKIKDPGAEVISKLLENNKARLKYLNLSKNMIEFDFFGATLTTNDVLISLDISYNNYTTESFESILRGLQRNHGLKNLDLRGMKVAANVNALALADIILINESLAEIAIDLDLELVDENMIFKLEESLLRNTTLLNIKSNKFEISLHNKLSNNIYRLLKANEWINKNYERLCNNEEIECHELIEELVRQKLEIMTAKIKQEGIEASIDTTNQLVYDGICYYPGSDIRFTDHQKFEFAQTADFTKNNGKMLEVGGKMLEVGDKNISSLSKSIDYASFEDGHITDNLDRFTEYQKQEFPSRTPNKKDDLENRLFMRLTAYIDEKIEKNMNSLQTPFELILNRLENMEQNYKKISEKINEKDSEMLKSQKSLSKNQEILIEPRIINLEGCLIEVNNEIKKLSQKIDKFTAFEMVEQNRRPEFFDDRLDGSQSSLSRTLNGGTQSKEQLETFLGERLNFENVAKTSFTNIFEKINDLSDLIGSLIKKHESQDVKSKTEQDVSLIKERDKLELMLAQKMEQLLTSRMKNIEGALKGTLSNLRNTVNQTQNRLKNLEESVLDNQELDPKDLKKNIRTVNIIHEKEEELHPKTQKSEPMVKRDFKTLKTKSNSNSDHIFTETGDVAIDSDIRKKSSPKKDNDDHNNNNDDNPLSLKELQGVSSSASSSQQMNINKYHAIQSIISSSTSTSQKPKVVDFNIDNSNREREKNYLKMPDSIKRAKEEIKKKIDNYRTEATPQKKKISDTPGSSTIKYSNANPQQINTKNTLSTINRTNQNSSGKKTGNIAPSEELVQLLRNRGFQFETR